MSSSRVTRRHFLKQTATGAAVLALGAPRSIASGLEPFTFGLCADVHQDVMPDATERMAVFVRAMNERKATFIAQLGDFCIPKQDNRRFLDTFHSFEGPHYHVLGNHDTDSDNLTKSGYTQKETKAFWGMPGNYYSFVHGGIRFIVLDGNDRPEDGGTDYPRHIGKPQRQWLDAELARTEEPIVVLSHQGAEHPEGIDNGATVRSILENANRNVSGHHHLNYHDEVGGIPYVQVNSMSYFWVGEECQNFAYPPHIHAANPMLEFTAPYRDPLWTMVTVDPDAGEIRIEGRTSVWAGASPEELGYQSPPSRRRGMSPRVDERTLAFRAPA